MKHIISKDLAISLLPDWLGIDTKFQDDSYCKYGSEVNVISLIRACDFVELTEIPGYGIGIRNKKRWGNAIFLIQTDPERLELLEAFIEERRSLKGRISELCSMIIGKEDPANETNRDKADH